MNKYKKGITLVSKIDPSLYIQIIGNRKKGLYLIKALTNSKAYHKGDAWSLWTQFLDSYYETVILPKNLELTEPIINILSI